MNTWTEQLQQIESEHREVLMARFGLGIQAGEWADCAVLKLQKPSWTDGGFDQGVFFSVWLGPKEVKAGRALYNIHALKLRLREGYTIRSNEFADAFRREFAAVSDEWPNVSVNHGPQTLMKGWIPLDPESFQADTEQLIARFTRIHSIIDRLFDERRAGPSRPG